MKKKLASLVLALAIAVTGAFGQIPIFGGLPVFDGSNLANAIKRHFELVRQYEQLVVEYEQLVLEYEHFLWMAKRLPGLNRHKLSFTPWRYSSSTNVYGTSGGWTSAINSGGGVVPGYRQATEPLRAFGAALSSIPTNQVERVKRDFATVELTDAANLHGMEVLGAQRAKARANERSIMELEGATLSTSDEMNTHIAVLNKINAAGMMAIRASQDTNQLLVAVLEHQVTESKLRRDAEAAQISDHVAFRSNARGPAAAGIVGSTRVLSSFRIP